MSTSKYLRKAARAAGAVERTVARAAAPGRNVGFPFRAPTVPGGVDVLDEPPTLGADYDTRWARTPLARAARGALVAGPVRVGIRALADPEVFGHDRLEDLLRGARHRDEDPPPVIFAPNHHSHLDTGLMVRAVPASVAEPARHRGGGRLLLRQALEGPVVGARAQRDPHRSRVDGTQVRRPHGAAHLPRMEPRDLPRGRTVTRRLGPNVQGRRRVPRRPHRRPGRPGVHRRHGLDHGQGHQRPEAWSIEGDVRSPAVARRGRVDAPVQRTNRAGRRRAGRRVDHRLLVGASPRRRPARHRR